MGGVVSAGENNEELVDNLCEAEYITTPEVETVFRKVDRGDYLLITDNEEERLEAYQDSAWRKGTLHLSAPCIYTRAVEALKFKQGMSFLNIGSGTGYLSTLVGFLLSSKGVNHGVELYQENVEYAREKLEEFKATSKWYDPTEFSEPLFVVGNGLLLSDQNRRYDRVYVGAACATEECQTQMKNFLEIDGIIVMPTDSQLVAVTRLSETEWKTDVVLSSVAFAPLILPSSEKPEDLVTFTISKEVNTLKSICRQKTLCTLTRKRFADIGQLPVPTPMKIFLTGGREWEPPSPPPKNLCPLQKKNKDGTSEEEEVARGDGSPADLLRRRAKNGRRGRGQELQFGIRGLHGQRVVVCNFNGLVVEFPVHSLRDPDSEDSSDGEGREEEQEEEGDGEQDRQMEQANQEDEIEQDLGEDAVPLNAGAEKKKRKRRGFFPFGLRSRNRHGGSDDDDGDGNMMEVDPTDRKGGNSAEALAEGDSTKPPKRGGWLKGLFRRTSSNKSTESPNPSPSMEKVPPVQKKGEEDVESNEDDEGTPTLSDFD